MNSFLQIFLKKIVYIFLLILYYNFIYFISIYFNKIFFINSVSQFHIFYKKLFFAIFFKNLIYIEFILEILRKLIKLILRIRSLICRDKLWT